MSGSREAISLYPLRSPQILVTCIPRISSEQQASRDHTYSSDTIDGKAELVWTWDSLIDLIHVNRVYKVEETKGTSVSHIDAMLTVGATGIVA
jgi:hypothetical protein